MTNQVVDMGLLPQTAEPAREVWASRRSTSSPIAATSELGRKDCGSQRDLRRGKGVIESLASRALSGGAAARGRASHEGMVSVGGNLYSVPDTTRRRVFDVHVLADQIRIFEDGALVASHAPLEGRGEKRLDPSHRKPINSCRRSLRDEPLARARDRVVRRSLDFYAAVGRRLAAIGGVR